MSKKSTKLEALHDLFEENNIQVDLIEGNGAIIEAVKKNAGAIQDYRHQSYVRHPLVSIVMIVFFAVLANADEWAEIETFAKKKEKWLREHLDLPYGIPTDDTYRIVMGNIDTGHFFRITVKLLIEAVDSMLACAGGGGKFHERSITSIDGKVSRGSARKEGADGEVKALQTLNVYSGDHGICLGQRFIEEKTNEIPAAQEVLRLMDLKGTIVTADAMNCQKDTAAAVINAGGDYVLALKGNQQLFYEEVKGYFDTDMLEELCGEAGHYRKTVDKGHGGTAVREYYITEDIQWFSEIKKWKKLKSIGMVHKALKKTDGGQTEEYRYYICSIGADAEEFERAARGHWGVENSLHWQLDFTFGDDKNTSMAKTCAKNLQVMKKVALSILRLVRDSYKISMKRIRYDLSLDFENGIEKMLSLLDIDSIKKLIESNGKSSQK